MTGAAWMLVAIGAYLIAINYCALVRNSHNRRRDIDRHHSFVPILGGLLFAGGLYFLVGSKLVFVATMIDPGVWVLAHLPMAILRQKPQRNEP